jgi:hypothetical protein
VWRASNATDGRARKWGCSSWHRSHTGCPGVCPWIRLADSTSVSVASAIALRVSPEGMGVRCCNRIALLRLSPPALSCPSPDRAKQGSNK